MMKKNTEKTKKMKGMFLWALPLVLVSCGSFQGVSYYGDGIYGEELPVEIEVVRDEQPRTNPTHYKSYFNEMAQKANEVATATNYTPLTDIDSYQSATDHPSYAGWGQNTSRDNVTINVYDDYYNRFGGYYDPYYNWNYGSNYYWGMGAWSPYYGSSWGYYGPRNRVSFGFGWSSGWNYPYYGYDPYYYGYNYYGYSPYYYGYGYDPYYYGGGYYPYYGNTVYRNSNNYVYARGRRGSNVNSDYSNTNSRGQYNNNTYRNSNKNNSRRDYSRSSGSYTPAYQSSYSRNAIENSEIRTYQPTNRSYERSYTPSSSSSGRDYGRSYNSSSRGRTYSSGRRGG